MSKKADPQPEPQQRPAPILTDTRRLNCPITVGPKDRESGARELSFVISPLELETFVLQEDAQAYLVKEFSGGLEIVGADALPKEAPDEPR